MAVHQLSGEHRHDISTRARVVHDCLSGCTAQGAGLFNGEQEMLGGTSEAIKVPHQHAIEPALAGVVHQPIQCRTALAGAGMSVIDILAYFQIADLSIGTLIAELRFGALPVGADAGVNGSALRTVSSCG